MKELWLAVATYTHRALFHDTDGDLVDGLVPFVTEGIADGERVVVVVSSAVGDMLRGRLGFSTGYDLWNSADVYTHPVHTLAAYIETVRAGTENGRPMRVAGQPVWAGLSPLEVAEWTCVEAACNVVFASARLSMLCPYDTSLLDPAIIDAARRTHPEICSGSHLAPSPEFDPFDHQSGVRASELPPRPESAEHISIFSPADVAPVLSFVEALAREHGMADVRVPDLRIAVEEVIAHGIDLHLGPARLHVWVTDVELIYEIESCGSPGSPFAGYLPPADSNQSDVGLWLAGQRCDLIAVRESVGNTVVRGHFDDYLVSVRPDCQGVDTLLGAYVLGACAVEETALVEAHLPHCEECRAEAARLGHVVNLMQPPDERQ